LDEFQLGFQVAVFWVATPCSVVVGRLRKIGILPHRYYNPEDLYLKSYCSESLKIRFHYV